MSKKSFWQGLTDFFKSEDEHLITDEEWEQMQAEQAEKAAKEQQENQAAEPAQGVSEETGAAESEAEAAAWQCPECKKMNEPELVFCRRCGYHPGSFAPLVEQMSTSLIELVLNGNSRYPKEERALLEAELQRRSFAEQARQDEQAPVDEAELQRLTQEYEPLSPDALYEIVENLDYTPEARLAARAALRAQGQPELREKKPQAEEGWKCVACGAENREEDFFCVKCGEYRY